MRPVAATTALVLLAACGSDVEPAREPPVPAEPLEVRAIDEMGPIGGEVAGIAVWAHPTLPFNGLTIAAGAAGIVAFNIEDGAEISRDDLVGLDGVSLSYLGTGPLAQAYVATRIADGDRSFRFYAIDNATRALSLLDTLFISDRNNARGYCLGRNKSGDGLVLHEMGGEGWRSLPLSINGRTVSSREPLTGSLRGGFLRCVADDIDGAAFAITETGDIYRLEDANAERLIETGVANADGIGIALNGLVEGGPTEECCGQIAVLDGESAVVHLFDREDGRRIGAVRLAASFDVETVEAATAMGFGYGNFGAVFRDGVLALATAGEEPVLRLTPLNGVMDALGAPLGPTADPRGLAVQEDDFVIEVDIVKP